ncbi:endolytic transglycosylase MltG [Candidatus Saccharibacteria bacterium]|nr:endolytic transglycosylase MltG [Candidatus Saccharibacteria bacterium]
MKFNANRPKAHRVPHRIWLLLVIFVILIVGGIVVTKQVYIQQLSPLSSDQRSQIFTVKTGTSDKQISKDLEQAKLIRSSWAMELYIHSHKLAGKLQAGTYAFSPSQGTSTIATTLTVGKVTTKLVTILPGRRIDQIRANLINYGFSPESVDAALRTEQYAGLPALAYKPANITSLEGLLWPDSFQKDGNTTPEQIIRESLTAMGHHLTPEVQAGFAMQNLTTYQGITLASIIEQEVSNANDRAQAAQVFLTRLKMGMMLGSDVTANYGAIAAGRQASLAYDSPYNTLKNVGLPPGPISTISASSLKAAGNPAATSWLYFVAGDDGITYFSKTLDEHQALTNKHCFKLCGR